MQNYHISFQPILKKNFTNSVDLGLPRGRNSDPLGSTAKGGYPNVAYLWWLLMHDRPLCSNLSVSNKKQKNHHYLLKENHKFVTSHEERKFPLLLGNINLLYGDSLL